jgi:Ca2+-binding EF-hand superfamily protein
VWEKVDSARRGDINFEEFDALFSSQTSDPDLIALQDLAKIFCHMCDAAHKLSLTIGDVFSAFDRNGSGLVSVAEFTSLVKVLLGAKAHDRKLVFKAFSALDSNLDKQLTIDELSTIMYFVWRTQLDVHTHAVLSGTISGDTLRTIYEEKESLKATIVRSFDRKFRDEAEAFIRAVDGPMKVLMASIEEICKELPGRAMLRLADTETRTRTRPSEAKAVSISNRLRFTAQTSSAIFPRREGFTLTTPKPKTMQLNPRLV